MKNLNIYLSAIALFAVILTACDDKTEYVAALPDSPDCMGVYFDENNPQDLIFVPGQESTLTLTMHRINTSSAADVPIIGKSTAEGIVFPSNVHFDAGSADAEITIDCNSLPLGEMVRISVDVPDQYINHYAETLFNYETTALLSEWLPANTDGSPVKFFFTDQNYVTYNNPKVNMAVYQPVESEMYVMPGAGMILVKNFINSGVDITFSLSPSPFSDFIGMYRISPLDHCLSMAEAYEDDSYGDEWYNAWYLLNDEDDYADVELTELEGGVSTFDYPMFYWYSNNYVYEYSVAMLKSDTHAANTAIMGISGTPAGTVTLPSYFYLFFSWDGPSGI